MFSLPTPLSPITKTEISVLETRIAFSSDLFRPRLLPIMPKRCFILCNESIVKCFLNNLDLILLGLLTYSFRFLHLQNHQFDISLLEIPQLYFEMFYRSIGYQI